MKIIIVGPAHPYRGGIADTNEAFARALIGRGHEASIVTFVRQYPDFLFPGKTQYSAEAAPESPMIVRKIDSVNPLNWTKTARYINEQIVDLVIFRFWMPFMGMCFSQIAKRLDKRVMKIGFCDNVIPHEPRVGDRFLSKIFVNQMDSFVTMSQTVAEELRQFTDKKNLYHPHPINDQLEAKVDKIKAREYLSLDPDGEYILFFGLVRKYKGVDLLLQAFAKAANNNTKLRLIIAGEFYEDPSYYFDLIDSLGVTNRVIVKNEFIASADIKYYFSAADLLALTYRSASQSGVTQIGFQYDLPMLITNVGGLSEYIEDGSTGYVCAVDQDDIATHITRYFNENKASAMSQNVAKAKQKYSWANLCAAIESELL